MQSRIQMRTKNQSGLAILEFAIILPFLIFIVMLILVSINHNVNSLIAEQALYISGTKIQDNKDYTNCTDGQYALNQGTAKAGIKADVDLSFTSSGIDLSTIKSGVVNVTPIDETKLYVLNYKANYDSQILPDILTNYLLPIDVNFIVSVTGECTP